eukprot:COSAG01_NODE_13336_length_1599_cov_1.888667_1_plen_37_part_10
MLGVDSQLEELRKKSAHDWASQRFYERTVSAQQGGSG